MRVRTAWCGLAWLVLSIGTATVCAAQITTAKPPATRPTGYAGSAECADCHKKVSGPFAATTHGKLQQLHAKEGTDKNGCESCHGPGKQHAESGGEERGALITFGNKPSGTVAARNAVCLTCHQKTNRMLWQGSAHESRDVACTSCHSVMKNESARGNLKQATVIATCGSCHAQQRSKAMRSSHMPLREGKMECSSCHNPHGSPNPKLLLAASANETCLACHAEKRGPFLWQHAPVTENCLNCHDSHGSSHGKMLNVPRQRLCQQCHNVTQHPSQPRNPLLGGDAAHVLNRQCSNCHSMIHGSNHPSGKFFTR